MTPAAGGKWPYAFPRNWLFRPAGTGSTLPLSTMEHCCPIVELRRYAVHPGARDTLIRLFDTHFVESQEHCGMRIIGQFRDLDDPDRFVWLRGFADMEARTRALQAFYGGPVWKEHGPAANATMVDHTDVLLLKPLGAGFRLDPAQRPGPDGSTVPAGLVIATIDHLEGDHLEAARSPDPAAAACDEHDGDILARLVTETARNGYPRLPVREDANVLVTLVSFPTLEADGPAPPIPPGLRRRERLRLQPTARSLLRHLPLPSGERAG